MKYSKNNNLFLFAFLGLICCFILKNLISVLNNSYGGDPVYIISNPSIDAELWYFLGFTYALSIRVFFKDFFALVVLQLKQHKFPLVVLDYYYSIYNTKMFKILIKVGLIFLSLITIALTFSLFENNEIDNMLNWLLFVYLTFIFNKNFRIVEFKND